MELTIYQVDAFTKNIFGGNPAAICPLEKWLDKDKMQKIALENNLSETAFFVKNGDKYDLRWFTPVNEVNLCGHATLASAFVYFNFINKDAQRIVFSTLSGDLIVERKDDLLIMNFPSNKPHVITPTKELLDVFPIAPKEVLINTKNVVVFETEKQVREMKPDIKGLLKVKGDGAIITAPGEKVDFVSRYFAPHEGIDEDPVTGSAHTHLVPYWSEKLGKKKFHALQVSSRVGELFCEDLGDRVQIAGYAALYLIGKIFV